MQDADIIIDAIYGTGFHGEFNDEIREIARLINNSDASVYSLDIPSGLNGDTGEADPDTVKADYTIVFHCLKPAHIMESAKQYCGEIVVKGIGIS